MSKEMFSIEEMENIFEIGRNMQAMEYNDEIETYDSKESFAFALKLALDFEKQNVDRDDYYNDLDAFVIEKLLEHYGTED